MADVFISYAREDKGSAEKLRHYFEEQGYDVFWDDDIRTGDTWPPILETHLDQAKCIVVLWSPNSIDSDWVNYEAERGGNRQVLLTAKITDCEPRQQYAEKQFADLRGWTGDRPPEGMLGLESRIRELIDESIARGQRRKADGTLILAQKKAKTEHISISDHARDLHEILRQLNSAPEATRAFIENGYRELQSAQHAARFVLADRAPETHYAAAADHFKNALDAMADMKKRPARDGRSIEYFLLMERANSLALSEPVKGPKFEEALGIYRSLTSRDRADVFVNFRLGCALARNAHDEHSIHEAIKVLQQASRLTQSSQPKHKGADDILAEGRWIVSEISRQMGICHWRLSQIFGESSIRGQGALDDAIKYTTEACAKGIPPATVDPGDDAINELMTFTVIKATGNLTYLYAARLRSGRGSEGDKEAIRKLIAMLRAREQWNIVENQINIIDSIAYGAATIGEWKIASEQANMNLQSLDRLAASGGLSAEDRSNRARAQEIAFFSALFLDGRVKMN
jgi:TIR domain